jgi:hypothetical protein
MSTAGRGRPACCNSCRPCARAGISSRAAACAGRGQARSLRRAAGTVGDDARVSMPARAHLPAGVDRRLPMRPRARRVRSMATCRATFAAPPRRYSTSRTRTTGGAGRYPFDRPASLVEHQVAHDPDFATGTAIEDLEQCEGNRMFRCASSPPFPRTSPSTDSQIAWMHRACFWTRPW